MTIEFLRNPDTNGGTATVRIRIQEQGGVTVIVPHAAQASVDNKHLDLTTANHSALPGGTGAQDPDVQAGLIEAGFIVWDGNFNVRMPSSLIDASSSGDIAAVISSDIVSDSFRPGNHNLSEAWLHIPTVVEDAFTLPIPDYNFGLGEIGASFNAIQVFAGHSVFTDPLVLDLNGDGVRLTDWQAVPVLFDIDDDGSRELTGWVTSADGLVVFDLNGDGIINSAREVLSEYFNNNAPGTGQKRFRDGFEALASLDSNSDGQFDAADGTWTQLRVWKDTNTNGITDPGELLTFAELGITRITLASVRQSGEVRDGNEVLARGSFVIGGATREALAVNFLADPIGTISTAGNIVRSEGGQSTYVVTSLTGETVDLAQKGAGAAVGGAGNDTLIGDANANWLAGGLGRDTLLGGAGDDVLIIDAEDDLASLRGGAGMDIAMVVGDAGVSINLWQTEIEVFEGGRGDDTIIGAGLTNVFVRGGDGNDTIIGGKADDALSGEAGNDIIDGWEGDDLIRGHGGKDLLLGAEGNDVLFGGRDDDTLFGGVGNDVLSGDQGDDHLKGGAGQDVARFSGSYADYRITRNADGSYYVRDTRSGRDGLDRLTDIEKVSFADLTSIDLTLPSPLPVRDVLTLAGSGAQMITASQLLANDQDWQGDTLRITGVSDARGGTAVLQANGNVLFTPDPAFGGVRGFRYTIADSAGNAGAQVVDTATGQTAAMKGSVYLLSPGMPSDPLLAEQWYLTNANVIPVWADYSGRGVRVGVFEPAGDFAVQPEIFDYRHPDLAANVDPRFLASADAIASFSNHATLVAGVIGAARNGDGGVGVAYNAMLSGFSLAADDLNALRRMAEFDVANNSWTASPNFTVNFRSNPELENAFQYAVANGRGGLGTNIIFGAGNDRADGGNTNHQSLHNSPYAITVGAVNLQGDLGALIRGGVPFSNPGASILVSAPGSNVSSTSRLLLTDNGSVFGADQTVAQGTSFATPLVSGVVALMLEANRDLGYRDVQDILSLSATLVDAGSGGWALNAARNWNGGGMRISHEYGFGQVDARAAVRLAESWAGQNTWSNTYAVSKSSGALADAIPDGGSLVKTLTLDPGLTVEHVRLTLKLNHAQLGDLVVSLVSPGGTTSVLLDRPGVNRLPNGTLVQGDRGDGATTLDFDLGSVLHRGEASGGAWQLRIEDRAAGTTGTLTGWDLRLTGEAGDPGTGNDSYIYTDEFWQVAWYGAPEQASRRSLTDGFGWDVFNAAAVTANVNLSLVNGTSSTIGGRQITIGAATIIEDAVAGDGNDTLSGNEFANRLVGGRGNDNLLGNAGDDLLDGGRGLDTLTGGAGRDLFVLRREEGATFANPITDTVTDFSAAAGDRIAIVGFPGVTSFSALIITAEGTATRVSTGNGQSLLLQNTAPANLSTASVVFMEALAASGTRIGTSAGDTLQPEFTDFQARPHLILAGGGNDLAFGGSNADQIYGEDGDDQLVGDLSSDGFVGGRDTLFGGAGNDTLFGGAADDILIGGDGLDVLVGGYGRDTIHLDGESVVSLPSTFGAWGDSSNSTVYAERYADVFIVLPGGGTGLLPNAIQDLDLPNAATGFAGDRIDLTKLAGVASFAELSLAGTIILNGSNYIKVALGSSGTFVSLRGIAWSQLTAETFIFREAPLNQIGGSSADTLLGTAGGTTLDGGPGADRMEGRTGDDTYVVDNPGDLVVELPGGGVDTVRTSITYTLPTEVENLFLAGLADIDGTGNDANNRMTGNAGRNRLDGGAGIDWMAGGAGDDIYIVDDTADQVIEKPGEGRDEVRSSVSYTLPREIENLVLSGQLSVSATGNDAANILTGNAAANLLFGAEGADTLIGLAGDDVLDGGGGVDVAVMGVSSASATWTRSGATWTVTSDNGTDTLLSVEVLRFSDRDITLPPVPHDATGDGKADILWRSTGGDVELWSLNGSLETDLGYVGGRVPTTWNVVGFADATGNGKADILWRSVAGDVALWSLNGATATDLGVVAILPTAWSVAGFADATGDGKAEILWHSIAGDLALWSLDSAATTDLGMVGNVSTAWSVAGFADATGDGKADILLRSAAGDVALWGLNGSFKTDLGYVGGNAPLSWTVAGFADAGGDGKADILWRSTAGDVALWTLDGSTVRGASIIGNVPTAWSVAAFEDSTGDGRADILWRSVAGDIALWSLNGSVATDLGLIATLATAWTIVG